MGSSGNQAVLDAAIYNDYNAVAQAQSEIDPTGDGGHRRLCTYG